MALPLSARERLSQPLREAPAFDQALREVHSVPVGQWAWNQHAGALAACLGDLAQPDTPPADDFKGVREWGERFLRTRSLVVSHLLALEPFAPFDTAGARDVLRLVDAATSAAADAIETAGPSRAPTQDLLDAATWWTTRETAADPTEALRSAFEVPEPPVDEEGEFRADWVLQHYAYRGQELLAHLLPHLASFGVPYVTDVLAAVSIVGGVGNCQDPIAAYIQMDAFVRHYLDAPPDLATETRAHLDAAEPALRRARQASNRAWIEASSHAAETETRALALVDAYTPLVEGPFRQLSWALYCLRNGDWESPPMLTSLRERLIAAGGNLGHIAGDVVIPDLRNSDAHQTLEWDGFAEEFVTEGGRIPPDRVAAAVVLADSFVHGCEAGLAAVRALDVQADDTLLPLPQETGRMPSWRRVQAFFGTNRLRLTEARLNTRHASLRVERLAVTDINPCFQALVLAHRLLPNIESFSVSTSTGSTPLIVVSANALEAAMPVWEYAVSCVDQIPLSTFLPVNFDARQRVEAAPIAIRSVAWIAVDDAVGVINATPDDWDETTVRLIDARLRIVEMALEQAAKQVEQPSARLSSVLGSVSELRLWIGSTAAPDPFRVERHPALVRLRTQLDRWGPVPRHPLIADEDAPDLSERQPALREVPQTMAFRTL